MAESDESAREMTGCVGQWNTAAHGMHHANAGVAPLHGVEGEQASGQAEGCDHLQGGPLCANDDETKHPVKFRLWGS